MVMHNPSKASGFEDSLQQAAGNALAIAVQTAGV
jgi:hypothetical protein